MGKILFHEKQKFTQWWLWLILIASMFISIYFLVIKNTLYARMEGQDIETSEAFAQVLSEEYISSDVNIILLMVPFFLIFFLFMLLTLETKINEKVLHIRYFPFLKKKFDLKKIESAEIVSYGFVGYGIRISFKYGTVYNVKGNKGLAITLKSGKKYLIGTQKPEELAKVAVLIQQIKE